MRLFVRNIIGLFAILLLLIAGPATAQVTGEDPGMADTLYIDSATAYTNGIGVMPIRFFNDQELSAIEVTLRHESDEITLDSVSFVGGRLAGLSNKGYLIHDSVTYSVFGLVTSEALISPGEGLLGYAYYSYPSSITPQVIAIDTITIIDSELREHSTSFKPDAADPFLPQVKSGYLDIQSAPLVMDSIWLDELQANVGEPFVMDIHLFNERNVAAVSVALEFDPDYLTIDSATYAGLRGESAMTKSFQRNNSFGLLWVYLTYGDASPLDPGTGILTRLHFTVDAGAPELMTTIDSTTYFTAGNTFINLTSADGSIQFTPFFSPGSVDIKIATDVTNGADQDILPDRYELAQNYPNPFNPTTTIEFALPSAGPVRLDVYNTLGQMVRTLTDREFSAGIHQVTFDGRSGSGSPLASGIYFYRLATGEYTDTRKMILVK